jgi:hypothetical protein
MAKSTLVDVAKEDTGRAEFRAHGKGARRLVKESGRNPNDPIVLGAHVTVADSKWLRQYAIQHDTTVSALVRNWIRELREGDGRR